MTWKKVGSPVGPGTPKSKSSPDQTWKNVSKPIGPGAPKNKPSAKVGGVPGREGKVTPAKAKPSGMNGQKGNGSTKAAGTSVTVKSRGAY